MSVGSSDRIVPSLACTSWYATSTFFSSSNSITTCEKPSALVERRCLIALMVDTASSMESVTVVSIVTGSAPRSSVRMVMTGNSTRGNRSIPIRWNETTPNTMMAAMTIVVSTGRRMAVSERIKVHVLETKVPRRRVAWVYGASPSR